MTVPSDPTLSNDGNPQLVAACRWAALDAEYGDHVWALLNEDPAQAVALMAGRLNFGTAGLRAPMGPGPLRMNRLVVRQTTAGLMVWLGERLGETRPTVVVGFDARHNSETYAGDVADVVARFGGRVDLIDRPTPTPVLARAVLDQQADAGVMITASHNPPADNGYKLYLGDGLQIVSPVDTEIAAFIESFAEVDPLADSSGGSAADRSAIRVVTDQALAAHRRCALAALTSTGPQAPREVSIVYTPLHGVGGDHLLACLAAAGFPTPVVVEEQFSPNPDFPGTPFPNPEEPGTLDRALALAAERGADVVLANDPDADRLAVAVPNRRGVWAPLSGDQVGILLADRALNHAASANGGDAAHKVVASSIVSSQMIDRLATASGATSVRTLTGFKWVARVMVDRPDDRFLFGYEEALGYCVGDEVRDKDGVSAALAVAELVAELKRQGQTLWGRLDALAVVHDLSATSQVTVRFDQVPPAERAAVMAEASRVAPDALADARVVERVDLALGGELPPTPGVVLHLDDGSRVVVRPSGTEPKVKAYLEVRQSVVSLEHIHDAYDATNRRLGELATAVIDLFSGPA